MKNNSLFVMNMSTSIGNIDIEGQLPLKHKNYDFLTLVLPLDFKIFQTPRVTVIRIGCKSRQISFPYSQGRVNLFFAIQPIWLLWLNKSK